MVNHTANFTGRKRITHNRVTVSINSTGEGPDNFDVKYDLADLDFPGYARVFIDATTSSETERYDCGTVIAPKKLENAELPVKLNVEEWKFQLRVVDKAGDKPGVLLGVAKGIRPVNILRPKSILHTTESDLGRRIWDLDKNKLDAGEYPLLIHNQKITEQDQDFYRQPANQVLILADCLRQVLIHICLVQGYTSSEEISDAEQMRDWLQFAEKSCGLDLSKVEGHEDKLSYNAYCIDAIDTAVRKFHDTPSINRDLVKLFAGLSPWEE